MINKSKIIAPSDDEDLKLVLSRACDLYTKADATSRAFYTKFLSPLEMATIMSRFPKDELHIKMFGGYADAERCVASFFTYEDELLFPISVIEIRQKSKNANLSHRDYMGSMLSLGIKRETLGDIVVTSNGAYVFCLEEIADYIADNVNKIGNTGVSISVKDSYDEITIERKYEIRSSTVSSLRCDSVVASAVNVARSKATSLIESGFVTLNYEQAKSQSQPIKNNDVISVRGYGKFRIETDSHLTKKGRIHINILKYV